MASITIRGLDETAMRGLRLRAAARGVPVEEEIRSILSEAAREAPLAELGALVHELFAPVRDADPEPPRRDAPPDPPKPPRR